VGVRLLLSVAGGGFVAGGGLGSAASPSRRTHIYTPPYLKPLLSLIPICYVLLQPIAHTKQL
jgi:hypothetical protein